jgi:hypothetical protein
MVGHFCIFKAFFGIHMPWEAFGVLRTEKKAAYGGLRFANPPYERLLTG